MPDDLPILPSRPFLSSLMAVPVHSAASIGATLRQQIDSALSTVPAGRTGALLVSATTEGVRLVIAHRTASAWEIGAWVETGWAGAAVAGVAVRRTWGPD